MELRQIEYFVAVAKHGNFSRAAREIHVSQSNLSQQISKLEAELGVRLFARTPKGVHLTAAGSEFAVHAKQIVGQVGAALSTVREYSSPLRGQLTLGFIPVLAFFDLTPLISSFRRDNPGVKMAFVEAECADLATMLHDGEIDAAILTKQNLGSSIEVHPLLEDELVLLTSTTHPFATRGLIDLHDARNEEFVFLPPSSGLYADCVAACRAAGFEPKVLFTCSHVETVLGLVSENLAVSMLSRKVSRFSAGMPVNVVRFRPVFKRHVVLAVPRSRPLPRPVAAFVKHTLRWVHSHAEVR